MDDVALAAFLDRAFEFVCTRPLGDFVDVDRVMAGVDAALTPPRVSGFVARFIAPARERLLAGARTSEALLGTWIPEPTRDAIATLLGAPMQIPPEMIEEFVTSDEVRDSVRAMLQESFTSMLAKAMKSPLAWGAGAAVGLFGGMTDRLGERLGQFMDLGVGIVQRRIAEKLADPATAKALGKRRRRGFLRLLKRKEREAVAWIDRIPHAAIDALTPSLIAHNLARPEIRAVLRAEIEHALRELTRQPIGALLEEYGVKEILREGVKTRGVPLARAFLACLT